MKKSITNKNRLAFLYAYIVCVLWPVCAMGESKAEKKVDDDPAPIRLEELHKRKPASKPVETQPVLPSETKEEKAPEKPWSIADEKIDFRLLKDPLVPITAPKGALLRRNIRNQPLPVEGMAVVNRVGTIRLDKDSGWMSMTFENQPGKTWVIPRRLLQCRLLERVEEILATNSNTRFSIIGETTIHAGNAYLIFRRVAVLDSPPPPKAPKPSPDKTAPKPLVMSQKSESKKAAAPPPAKTEQKKNANKALITTTDLISAMMKDTPQTALRVAMVPHRSRDENVVSVAPAGKEPLNPGRKSMVVDRLVRLVQSSSGHWWEVHFESDNTLREPPMRILPNSLLSRAVQLNNQLGQGALKLRVSGEITFYKDQRYLLLRKILRQRDMDQF